MPRKNKGSVTEKDGLFYPRVRWTTEEGRSRDYKLPPTREIGEAYKAVVKKQNELKSKGAAAVDAEKMRFGYVAEEFKKARLYPARIVNGKKIGGVKSLQPLLCALTALIAYFGSKRLRDIRHSDLEKYREHRLDTPTKHGTQRKIASVNRELELARTIFKFAIEQRWIQISPFVGRPVIQRSAETVRERTLTVEEQERILSACRKTDKNGRNRRLQLIPLLIASWDTAARRGELITLRWCDVDFGAGHHGTLVVTSGRSKTGQRRIIGLTTRLRAELLKLWEKSAKDPNDLVFGYRCSPKTAFMAACKEAGIEDYRWHDNRHTATTLMMKATANPLLVKKITGHTQNSTFERYYNPSVEMITSVADDLGKLVSDSASVTSKNSD